MSKAKAWLYAFRLRTLPLAFSSVITGSSMAYFILGGFLNVKALVLCLVTTLLLQILSNLSNDYGDSEKGADNEDRIGPKRAVQAGLLSAREMKAGVIATASLALVSGLWLIAEATKGLPVFMPLFFLLLGLSAIGAAVKYTVGKSAYGYSGWGDIFVFLFFGLAGVGGSYFLLSHQFTWSSLCPAVSIGLFATGVLNLNNLRDHVGDQKAGKNTLVVKWGMEKAKSYHRWLIITGFLSAVLYVVLNFNSTMQFLFLITFPLFRRNVSSVQQISDPADFDPLLKQLAVSTFIFSLLFAAGMVIGLETQGKLI